MRRLLWGQLRHRRGRLAALGLAILVAAASFTLLTASARTSSLHVHGTLESTYRTAYDIYVRPPASATPLERNEGLVQSNFLSGIYGGITLAQWREIERLRGVDVAAPIANLGYVFFGGFSTFSIKPYVDGSAQQLFKITQTYVADDGTSRYSSGGAEYLFHHPRPLRGKYASIGCGGFASPRGNGMFIAPPRGPFDPALSTGMACGATPGDSSAPGATEADVAFWFPVKVAAIDPVQEARLVHLDGALASGRYLNERDGVRPGQNAYYIPVLASTRTFLGEQLASSVERLTVPPGVDVQRMLASGACIPDAAGVAHLPCAPSSIVPPPPGTPWKSAYDFVTSLPGRAVGKTVQPASSTYQSGLRGNNPLDKLFFDAYWTDSPVRYRTLGPDHLAPMTVTNPVTIWQARVGPGDSSYLTPPPDNEDVQFRALHQVRGRNVFDQHDKLVTPVLHPVGQFDPNKLPGFSPLTKVPLETYYPPELEPADAASKRALHDEPLLPSQNLGGYIQQPPLLLTTIKAFQGFLAAKAFDGVPARLRRAPIAAIRVRVKGVTGFNALSETRIRVVAQEIHERTGLQVDITAGSSPHPVLISLPKGKYGRPALLLREGWSKKGASIAFGRALDRKDLALFGLILVVCAFFLGNGAFASVRARRAELGALATLGWSPAEAFRLVLGELAAVGVVAGLVGTGVAAALVSGFGLDLPLARTLYVLPIAVALAVLAGLLPAWRAARGRPLDAVRPPVTGSARPGRVRSLARMALVDLARLPVRTVVGAAGLALGVTALTAMVGIERGFQGTLVGTILGSAVSVQVRGADFVALGLTLALAALSTADVLYLNVRERQAEIVTLATLGWSDRETRRLLSLEALYLAASGGLAGAIAGILIGKLVLGVGLVPLVAAAGIAAGAAIVAALAASLLPLVRLRGFAAPEVLAAE